MVNRNCEPEGLSHAVIDHRKRNDDSDIAVVPVTACGTDGFPYNWTLNPKPKTQLCPRCKKALKA
jgi:hypothetical protein